MGRELKRVPVDFNWPLGKRWEGFLNPHRPRKCPACGGDGYSPAAKRYRDEWYGYVAFDPAAYGSKPLTLDSQALRESVEAKIRRAEELVAEGYDKSNYYTNGGRIPFERAVQIEVRRMFEHYTCQWMHQLNQADVDALVEEGRLHDFTHRWTQENGWQPDPSKPHPTADDVNAWSMFGFGHDSINQWVCADARAKREGETTKCPTCDGHGDDPTDAKTIAAAEAWTSTGPPEGPAYQVWETTSEGSPISPPFLDPRDLARWMADNRKGTIDEGTTYEQWLAFITGPGWAYSSAIIDGEVMTGVQAVTRENHE